MDLLQSIPKSTQNFLVAPKFKSKKKNLSHSVIYFRGESKTDLEKYLSLHFSGELTEWQIKQLESVPAQSFKGPQKTVWIFWSNYFEYSRKGIVSADDKRNVRGIARDVCGQWLRSNSPQGEIEFTFVGAEDEEIFGAILGLGLASYSYIKLIKGTENSTQFNFRRYQEKMPLKIISAATALFQSTNLARHLINLPGESANPEDLSKKLGKFLGQQKNLTAKIYSESELKKEKCGLLVGVGQGSRHGARLLKLSYQGKKNSSEYLAFVGKGVTFDTGGLDIKNSAGMRLMKKDMGGAAVIAGLSFFVSQVGLPLNLEFYLPLAENSVSAEATRPGDTHIARNGSLVEIDNTDAEGRLVMADAICMALGLTEDGSHKEKSDSNQKKNTRRSMPKALIDASTLTGAMRVALGLDVAGFFANDDQLAQNMESAAASAGESIWRLPLYKKYEKQLSSNYADFKNSSDSGYGGAITAALFLQKFVGDVPWLHFDMMAWNLSADGAIAEGGNGQCLQTLATFLMSYE